MSITQHDDLGRLLSLHCSKMKRWKIQTDMKLEADGNRMSNSQRHLEQLKHNHHDEAEALKSDKERLDRLLAQQESLEQRIADERAREVVCRQAVLSSGVTTALDRYEGQSASVSENGERAAAALASAEARHERLCEARRLSFDWNGCTETARREEDAEGDAVKRQSESLLDTFNQEKDQLKEEETTLVQSEKDTGLADETLAAVNKKCASNKELISNLEKNHEDIMEETADKLDQTEAALASCLGRIKALVLRKENLGGEFSAVEGEISNERNLKSQCEVEIEHLWERGRSSDLSLAEAENLLTECKAKLEKCLEIEKTEAARTRKEVEQVQSLKAKSLMELQKLEEANTLMKGEIESLESKIDEIGQVYDEIETARGQFKEILDQQHNQHELIQSFKTAKMEFYSCERNVKALESSCSFLKIEVNHVESSIESAKAELNKMAVDLEKLKNAQDTLMASISCEEAETDYERLSDLRETAHSLELLVRDEKINVEEQLRIEAKQIENLSLRYSKSREAARKKHRELTAELEKKEQAKKRELGKKKMAQSGILKHSKEPQDPNPERVKKPPSSEAKKAKLSYTQNRSPQGNPEHIKKHPSSEAKKAKLSYTPEPETTKKKKRILFNPSTIYDLIE